MANCSVRKLVLHASGYFLAASSQLWRSLSFKLARRSRAYHSSLVPVFSLYSTLSLSPPGPSPLMTSLMFKMTTHYLIKRCKRLHICNAGVCLLSSLASRIKMEWITETNRKCLAVIVRPSQGDSYHVSPRRPLFQNACATFRTITDPHPGRVRQRKWAGGTAPIREAPNLRTPVRKNSRVTHPPPFHTPRTLGRFACYRFYFLLCVWPCLFKENFVFISELHNREQRGRCEIFFDLHRLNFFLVYFALTTVFYSTTSPRLFPRYQSQN